MPDGPVLAGPGSRPGRRR